MKIHDLPGGPAGAFEIDNFLLSRQTACRIVRTIPGAVLRKGPASGFAFPPWIEREDEFCIFEIDGEVFSILEPWGDSSRFLICLKTPGPSRQMPKVRDAFVQYAPLSRFFPWLGRNPEGKTK